MWSYQCPNKPSNLRENNRLIISKTAPEVHLMERPLVCIGLDGVILCKASPEELLEQPESWFDEPLYIQYKEAGEAFEYHICIRPKLVELLSSLNNHVAIVVYSSESNEFIEAVLLAVSTALANKEDYVARQMSSLIRGFYYWSKDQCIEKDGDFLKALAVVAEYSFTHMNRIWLIDDKPHLVDYSSHVIPVSTFKGDTEDLELLRVMHQIFND